MSDQSASAALVNLALADGRPLQSMARDELGFDDAPEVVVFNPWLVGDRDSLLASLFEAIAGAVERIEAPQESLGEKSAEAAVSTAKKLRSYAGHVGALSKALKLAGAFVPGGGANPSCISSIKPSASFADGLMRVTSNVKAAPAHGCFKS